MWVARLEPISFYCDFMAECFFIKRLWPNRRFIFTSKRPASATAGCFSEQKITFFIKQPLIELKVARGTVNVLTKSMTYMIDFEAK